MKLVMYIPETENLSLEISWEDQVGRPPKGPQVQEAPDNRTTVPASIPPNVARNNFPRCTQIFHAHRFCDAPVAFPQAKYSGVPIGLK